MESCMKSKLSVTKLILATTIAILIVPSQATWAMKHHHKSHVGHKMHKVHKVDCTGKGWHMVSKKCDIKPAVTWAAYESGVYTQPETETDMLFMK